MASEHDSGLEPQPSKTRRKKAMQALQDLGGQLTTLSSARLNRLDLPSPLLEAIREYHRLPNRHGAKRRQLQYIGRLMRESDHESLRRQLDDVLSSGAAEQRRQQQIDRWLEALLEGGEAAITEFLREHPQAQRQSLRQHLRDYQQAQNRQSEERAALKRRRLRDHLKSLI